MSNQKYYTNSAGITIWTPGIGAIWHIRDNELLYDYADTRVTPQDYANGLKEALGASGPTTLQPGDTIVCGPGKFKGEEILCDVNNITWLNYGLIIDANAATFSQMVDLTGDGIHLEGLTTEDTRGSGTGTGAGIIMRGDNIVVRNCRAFNHLGGTNTEGFGLHCAGDDGLVEGYYATGCKYTGIRALNADRLTIRDAFLYNNGSATAAKRCIQTAGSSNLEWIKLDNVTTLADTAGYGCLVNFGQAGRIQHVMVEGCSFTNTAAAQFNTTSREQNMKFENVDHISVRSSTFRHPSNLGGGANGFHTGIGVDLQTPIGYAFDVQGCTFSDGFVMFNQRWDGFINITNNTFGIDRVQNNALIANIGPSPSTVISGNRFLLDQNAVYALAFGNTLPLLTDYVEISKNRFWANKNADVSIADDANPPVLMTNNRQLVSFGNTLENVGTGTFKHSRWDGVNGKAEFNLMLQTDASGDMKFDDTLIVTGAMPDPGAGPNYFSANLRGYQGQRIWNINWSPDATQIVPEKGWIRHNGNWKEIT